MKIGMQILAFMVTMAKGGNNWIGRDNHYCTSAGTLEMTF